MQFTRSIASAALLAAVQAQSANVQVVYVGQNPANNATGAQFWPETITAEPGSMVQFQFWAGNHTATQSTFDDPCNPLGQGASAAQNGTGAGQSGLNSGYQPADASLGDGWAPTWSIMINDTDPLWFYCAQGDHCQNGMAMVINPSDDEEKSLDAYKEAAAAVEGGDEEGDDSEGGSGGSGGGSGGDGEGEDGDVPGGDADGAAGGSAATGLVAPSSLVLLAAAGLALF